MSYVSSSYIVFVDRIFSITCSMCPFSVATLLRIYVFTIHTVIPGHDLNYPFWFASIHVDLTRLNDAACSYLNKCVWFVMCSELLILFSWYFPIFRLLFMFSKDTIHNLAVFYCSC